MGNLDGELVLARLVIESLLGRCSPFAGPRASSSVRLSLVLAESSSGFEVVCFGVGDQEEGELAVVGVGMLQVGNDLQRNKYEGRRARQASLQ